MSTDLPHSLLQTPSASFIARLLVTLCFWVSGFTKLFWWDTGVRIMTKFHLEPAHLFNLAVILLQLGGSYLVIWTKRTWLGAVLLAGFTLLTIPVAFDFWNEQGPARAATLAGIYEHLSLIGGLLAVSILRAREPRFEPRG